jgi:flagellin-specific chaperone FliS
MRFDLMNPYAAYKRQQNPATPRIDVALALYRQALANLDQARAALLAQKPEAARSCFLKTQLIVASLSAELPAHRDATAVNFLRLYEFVAHQMTLETLAGVEAAEKVLRPLLEGFETVREQALALEAQGVIPPLDRAREVSMNV